MNIEWRSRLLSVLCVWALLAITACAANHRPQVKSEQPSFTQYPATPLYEGKAADVVLSDETRAFRTRLQEAVQQPANFAGEYVLTRWGCGAGCVAGAVVSRKTGMVSLLPSVLHVRNAGEHALQFRADSRLLVMHGAFREGGVSADHFYLYRDGMFIAVGQ